MQSKTRDELNHGKDWAMAFASNVAPEILRQIERALVKERQGTYGVCDECGNRIDWATLKACPQATLCFKCQSRHSVAVTETT